MTPLEIEILLHYHCSVDDYRNGDFSAPAVREAIDKFLGIGLLVPWIGEGATYAPTEGLLVYVNAICAVPAPVRKWVIPQRAQGTVERFRLTTTESGDG